MASVTYHKQPGIHKTRGSVPLAGTSHIYTVGDVLWPSAVEDWIAERLIGTTLHICCGKSRLGDIRVDLFEPDVDLRADAARLPFASKSVDCTLIDPPYNGKFQWNHDMISELIRVTRYRILFQHWFIIANKDGKLKKAHTYELQELAYVVDPAISGDFEYVLAARDKKTGTYSVVTEALGEDDIFQLSDLAAWQPRTYFGRAQIIQVYDKVGDDFISKFQYEQLRFSDLEVE